jgi:hypothetical protein
MSETKHSPLPWRIGGEQGGYNKSGVPYYREINIVRGLLDPVEIATLDGLHDLELAKANAELIVRAVNNLQPLIDALEMISSCQFLGEGACPKCHQVAALSLQRAKGAK